MSAPTRVPGRQPDGTWWCECVTKCAPDGKTVDRTTYGRHQRKEAEALEALAAQANPAPPGPAAAANEVEMDQQEDWDPERASNEGHSDLPDAGPQFRPDSDGPDYSNPRSDSFESAVDGAASRAQVDNNNRARAADDDNSDRAPSPAESDAQSTRSGSTGIEFIFGQARYSSRPPTPDNEDDSRPSSPAEDPPPLGHNPNLPDEFNWVNEFIAFLRDASFDNEDEIEPDIAYAHRNPPTEPIDLTPDERLSIRLYLATINASEWSYKEAADAVMERSDDIKVLSYHNVRRLVEEITGIRPVYRDMCLHTCLAYVGPFRKLDKCLVCQTPRYKPQKPRSKKLVPQRQFPTIPIGLLIQAIWRSTEGRTDIEYREKFTEQLLRELEESNGIRTSAYKDFFDGSDYLGRAGLSMDEEEVEARIRAGDMVLMFSMDGAQLYRNKVSEVWMYVWIIFDRAPDLRYKKRYILPGGFLPGPNPPKIPESFIFVGLYFLAACQREKGGFPVWDAVNDLVEKIRLHLGVVGADTLGMTAAAGNCGHTGKRLCRLMCPIIGRHKDQLGVHYPVTFLPHNYHVKGCDHPDVDLREMIKNHTSESAAERYEQNLILVASSRNRTQYKKNRRETGIAKPTIFSGLPSKYHFGVPDIFGLDFMHPILNLMDLMVPLWRGTFKCEKTDNLATWKFAVLRNDAIWKAHGQRVADIRRYFPISFHDPPRDPALKLSSGYKCWEFEMYFFGLGPALLYGILPDEYYRNFCSLVRGIRILLQESILPAEVDEAEDHLFRFAEGFERLYVVRRADRIHFVRPVIHVIPHMVSETRRKGPGNLTSQWALERTIGNIVEECQQHSNPYAHFAARGVRRCQVNSLLGIIPSLVAKKGPPHGAISVGDQGHAMLRRADNIFRRVNEPEEEAIEAYIRALYGEDAERALDEWDGKVRRYSRASLPNGQIARCTWSEHRNNFTRTNSMVKVATEVDDDGNILKVEIAEVRFFAQLEVLEDIYNIAVGSFFGPPDEYLLSVSHGTYWSAQHSGDGDVRLFLIPSIQSVVAMLPDHQYQHRADDESADDRFFLVEKPGLGLASHEDDEEEDDEDEDD